MNKFTLGMVAGMSTLTLAVPLVAQLSLAADAEENILVEHPTPTQECLLAKVALEDAHLASFDSMQATRKSSMQSRRDALAQVAAISDNTTREEALKQLHEDMRAARDEDQFEAPETVTTAMEAMKTACGDTMFMMKDGHHGVPGMRMHGGFPGGGKLLEVLGITQEELKAALESGKTIEQIAEEKGIELPAKPEGRFMKREGRFGPTITEVNE